MKIEHFMPWLLCVLLTACGSTGLASVPKIEVEIVNQSSFGLENAEARFGDYACKWGRVGKTFSAIYMSFPHPITEQTKLRWKENGKRREEKLDLRKIYPSGKSGRLTFTVYDGHVEVSFRETSSAK
jgi:hypothetical protein